MTEADWRDAMSKFLDGWTDAEIGRFYDVSNTTVARQRFNRGVYRVDRPAGVGRRGFGSAPPLPPSSAEGAGEAGDGAGAPTSRPAFALPEGDDAGETAQALLAHGRALLAQGRVAEAVAVTRLARSFLLATRMLPGTAGSETEAARVFTPLPVLRPSQIPPPGRWRTWMFLGGRGAGKTLAGAAWLAGRAKAVGRLALVGPTYADVREVMIEGPSGLRGAAAGFGPGGRPRYEPSRRRLLWDNGAVAQVFTAEEPDGLRGPQFCAAWGDEVCAWGGDVASTLALLRMGLRLTSSSGEEPKLMLTTTPRPAAFLRDLMEEAGLVVTRGTAAENSAFLAPGFLDELRGLYGGTRLERQELDGEVLEALTGAVFRRADLDRARALWAEGAPEVFDRLVVAVDPPAGLHGAACGLVVAGRSGGRVWVIEDATVHGLSPAGWADRVAQAAERAACLGPVEVVAEANQGGEMVRQVLLNAGVAAPVRLVHAALGKRARAEPVALLYEKGRVAHSHGLRALEDQLLLLGAGPERGTVSPDRADALVWAITALMLTPGPSSPRLRVL